MGTGISSVRDVAQPSKGSDKGMLPPSPPLSCRLPSPLPLSLLLIYGATSKGSAGAVDTPPRSPSRLLRGRRGSSSVEMGVVVHGDGGSSSVEMGGRRPWRWGSSSMEMGGRRPWRWGVVVRGRVGLPFADEGGEPKGRERGETAAFFPHRAAVPAERGGRSGEAASPFRRDRGNPAQGQGGIVRKEPSP